MVFEEEVRDQIIEDLIRIEELCSMADFYFLKLYNIADFKKKTKYFMISKQVIFFVIQRSMGRIESIQRNLEKLTQVREFSEKFLNRIISSKKILKETEKIYQNNKIDEIINMLSSVGNDMRMIRQDFKESFRLVKNQELL